jgi:hypothetical protein
MTLHCLCIFWRIRSIISKRLWVFNNTFLYFNRIIFWLNCINILQAFNHKMQGTINLTLIYNFLKNTYWTIDFILKLFSLLLNTCIIITIRFRWWIVINPFKLIKLNLFFLILNFSQSIYTFWSNLLLAIWNKLIILLRFFSLLYYWNFTSFIYRIIRSLHFKAIKWWAYGLLLVFNISIILFYNIQ